MYVCSSRWSKSKKKKRGARVGGEGSPTRTHIYKNEHVNCDECSLLFLLFIFFSFAPPARVILVVIDCYCVHITSPKCFHPAI